MVLKSCNLPSVVMVLVFTFAMLLVQCALEKPTPQPEPRIDLLYDGNTSLSDTMTYGTPTTVDITIYLYAVAGLKSHSILVNGESADKETYNADENLNCDTITISIPLSGNSILNREISISTTDWADQTSEKTVVIIFNPGWVPESAPQFNSLGPISTTVTVGDSATFEAYASGTNRVYQWQKNSVNIPGANTYAVSTGPTVIGDNGATFRCIVSNSAGSDTSRTAILTVTAPVVP